MKIFFDTNVLLRAHLDSQGPARRAVLHAINYHMILSSAYILGELERVLEYPRVQRHFHLTPARASRYVRELAEQSLIVTPNQVPAQLLRDGTDASVLGTALSGGADVICTCDGDFFVEQVLNFCAEQRIKILTDTELLRDPDFGLGASGC